MNRTIFTVLINNYDNLQDAPRFEGWDTVLFTDSIPKKCKGWKVRLIKPELSPEKESRRYKFLSHIYLSEYDLVCYMDANMILKKEPPNVPTWFTHPTRRTVTQEANRILQLKKESESEIRRQLEYYQSKNFNDRFGLYQNGFFVRDHSEDSNKLMEQTFETVKQLSFRDQLALPYAIFKTGIKPKGLINGAIAGRYFKLNPHNQITKKEKVNVHHITPARSDKNLGKAINDIIEKLLDNDWICLRDIDTFPPYHERFIQQVEEIANDPKGFDLIGCMTNRLGLVYQLVPNMFYELDIKKHRDKAKELAETNDIKPLMQGQTIGGLFMLFSKNTWIHAGKFPEGGIRIKGSFIDYHFSKAVKGKKGIATGIYLFHNYRIDSKDTSKNINHLL